MAPPRGKRCIPPRFNHEAALQLYLAMGSARAASQIRAKWEQEVKPGERVPSQTSIENWITAGGWVEKAKEYDKSTALAIQEATQKAVVARTLSTLAILEDTVYNSALWANELSKKKVKTDIPHLKVLNEIVLNGIKGHEYHRDTLYAKEQAEKATGGAQEVVVERTEKFTFLRERMAPLLLEAQVIDEK